MTKPLNVRKRAGRLEKFPIPVGEKFFALNVMCDVKFFGALMW